MNDERIQELEKEKEEAIALYNVEQCKSVHYKEAYEGLVKFLRDRKYAKCQCLLESAGAILKSEKHLNL